MRAVMRMQPIDEFNNIVVAPHPGWKASEAAQRFFGVPVVALAVDVSIHAKRIGPVGFPADQIESVIGDQALGDFGARAIKLVRAVAGFAEKHETAMAGVFEQTIVIAAI